ncbi:PTS system N-acetylglucosamine-specific IIB component (Glc family) /PTS system N-acetylglucosamine-specific IIC component (Glc family) [Melghirimyces profundicolus]|uniref:PTS system N-acetylglucosamine-specific IIB component (Glc family) /PTS system N-acetylglucosamine-specific IIC component (Glc family) n=1 Tax=Melghirimyces profundicolus TaxID=1242148 RepID=A0A2T6BGM8_9BACL|nr:PTS transporter subunit EIIC [Melghirimyces profundicolus]PTX55218.1 PTS system N-acetylglucosamine-specific IIB component (Glc family) /PTS system N-acetylglucosamine-specific IIC component (Glc family) [Melghirimyces profundicolus]
MKALFGKLQQVGKALMLPVAVLPAAAILMSLGVLVNTVAVKMSMEGSWLNHVGDTMITGGNGILGFLPILFAVGVAVGLSGSSGAAGLAAVAGYLVLNSIVGMDAPKPDNGEWQVKLDQTGVLGGIITGLVTAWLYRKYHDVRFPEWLQFFGGKRFVPIITSFVMFFVGILFYFIWPTVEGWIETAGNGVIGAGAAGLFGFGMLNRLLIPLGLHHIFNSVAWFQLGKFQTPEGEVVTGDLSRFLAGDPSAGIFMAGFFPIMMFALPAACLAMVHEAKPSQRPMVAGVLGSAVLTSFMTGITEPIEFSFMFLAPALYLIHAVLTGTSMALTYLLDVKHGFGFSAGLIDYLVNFHLSTNAWWIIPVGLGYGVIYYGVFRFAIRKFNLPTPGRIEETDSTETGGVANGGKNPDELDRLAHEVLKAIGGEENIEELDACITRLRITLKDEEKLDKPLLKKLGAAGVIRVGPRYYQAVFGTQSELLRDRILRLIGRESA